MKRRLAQILLTLACFFFVAQCASIANVSEVISAIATESDDFDEEDVVPVDPFVASCAPTNLAWEWLPTGIGDCVQKLLSHWAQYSLSQPFEFCILSTAEPPAAMIEDVWLLHRCLRI